MPLLDAALAFALTMLAISSLVGLILDYLYRLFHVRTRRLEKMIERFFVERALPELERQLRAKAESTVDSAQKELRRVVDRLEQEQKESAPAGDRPGRDPSVEGWLEPLYAGKLLTEVDSRKLVRLSARQIKEWIASSPVGKKIREALSEEEADAVLDQLRKPWDEIGRQFSESFREHSRTWATVVALVLAFGLNIDSLFLLETYLTDDEARAAVISEQAEILADLAARKAETDATDGAEPGGGGSPPAGNDDWDPVASFERIQGQALAFQSNRFAVGWDLFPNCPPSSVDWRCADYWQRVVESDGYDDLSYGQRQRLNPLVHPRTALFPASGTTSGSAAESAETVAHTATTGGPAGGRAERVGGEGKVPLPASYHGKLGGRALFGWVLGCLLTGVLAGVGSPFWYEVVQRLGLIRRGWHELRNRDEEERRETGPPAGGSPSDTPPRGDDSPPRGDDSPPAGGPSTR